jgi:hypothetical protein
MTLDVERLQALVLPWAKEKHPDKYQATLKVAGNAATFEKYLLRLLEIRWETDEDREWRLDVPLTALEETKIRQKLIWQGTEVEICGAKVEGRTWSFAELSILTTAELERGEGKAEFERLAKVKATLDLQVVETTVGTT